MVDNAKTSEGISRRTVTKAMAWAVPAIAVAAPVPAFAASGGKPSILVGPACKAPGASVCGDQFKHGYAVPVTITNDSNMDVWITGVQITAQSPANPTFTPDTSIDLPIQIAANSSVLVWFIAQSTNSANIQNGSITFSAAWGHESDGSDHEHDADPIIITTTWASTPPGCACFNP